MYSTMSNTLSWLGFVLSSNASRSRAPITYFNLSRSLCCIIPKAFDIVFICTCSLRVYGAEVVRPPWTLLVIMPSSALVTLTCMASSAATARCSGVYLGTLYVYLWHKTSLDRSFDFAPYHFLFLRVVWSYCKGDPYLSLLMTYLLCTYPVVGGPQVYQG